MNLIKLNASYNDLHNRIHFQINATTVKTALPVYLETTRLNCRMRKLSLYSI